MPDGRAASPSAMAARSRISLNSRPLTSFAGMGMMLLAILNGARDALGVTSLSLLEEVPVESIGVELVRAHH